MFLFHQGESIVNPFTEMGHEWYHCIGFIFLYQSVDFFKNFFTGKDDSSSEAHLQRSKTSRGSYLGPE